MIVLGVDPGTARMGYGIIEQASDPIARSFGVAITSSSASMPIRLRELYDQLGELITEHRPVAIAVESLFFARNVTTAISVGQARGVVLLAAAKHGVDVYEYSPSEVKHATAGYGKAEKHQIQSMVQMILRLPERPRPDDAADALAIALCHLHHQSGYLQGGHHLL